MLEVRYSLILYLQMERRSDVGKSRYANLRRTMYEVRRGGGSGKLKVW